MATLKLVTFNNAADQQTKAHEVLVAAILNSLLRQGRLIQAGQTDWDIGYTPAVPANWTGAAPTTLFAALDRIAAALVAAGHTP